MGREPLEIVRLASGLWYTERRDLITSLHLLFRVSSHRSRNHYLLVYALFLPFSLMCNGVMILPFQAVVLDQGLEEDLLSDIQKYLEDLINSGLRQRFISLIKVYFV